MWNKNFEFIFGKLKIKHLKNDDRRTQKVGPFGGKQAVIRQEEWFAYSNMRKPISFGFPKFWGYLNKKKKASPGRPYTIMPNLGRAIAQAVSRRFPTAAARIGAQVALGGICGGPGGTGAGFLRVLRLPFPIHIPIAPH
jgi:hypothetical protein